MTHDDGKRRQLRLEMFPHDRLVPGSRDHRRTLLLQRSASVDIHRVLRSDKIRDVVDCVADAGFQRACR